MTVNLSLHFGGRCDEKCVIKNNSGQYVKTICWDEVPGFYQLLVTIKGGFRCDLRALALSEGSTWSQKEVTNGASCRWSTRNMNEREDGFLHCRGKLLLLEGH